MTIVFGNFVCQYILHILTNSVTWYEKLNQEYIIGLGDT